jgi:hypothetical protein
MLMYDNIIMIIWYIIILTRDRDHDNHRETVVNFFWKISDRIRFDIKIYIFY